MELHIAIRTVVNKFGHEIVTSLQLVNILSDYQAFDKVEGRNYRLVLKNIISKGYLNEIYKLGVSKRGFLSFFKKSSLEKPKLDVLIESKKDIIDRYCNDFGHTPNVEYILDCVLFGLGWIDGVGLIGDSNTKNKQVKTQTRTEIPTNVVDSSIDPWNSEYLVVYVSPSNAKVWVDGRECKVKDGSTFVEVNYGEHTIKAQADLYKTIEKKISIVEGKDNKMKISLPENWGELVFSSRESVELYVDGQLTPHHSRLSPGKHDVKIISKYYEPYSTTVHITVGNKTIIPESVLVSRLKSIVVRNKYADAELNVDGKRIKIMGDTSFQLLPGKHTIKYYRPSYMSIKEDIIINVDDDNPVELFFPELTLAYGGLRVITMPIGQKVIINGVVVGKTPYKSTSMPIGSYKVYVKGDFTRKYDVTIHAGEITEIK